MDTRAMPNRCGTVAGMVLLAAVFLAPGPAGARHALDWKALHEEADRRTFEENFNIPAEDPVTLEEKYVLAVMCLNRHKDGQSGLLMEEMLQIDPEQPQALWVKAELLRRQHRHDESSAILKKLMQDQPGFAVPYLTMAYIRYVWLDFEGSSQLALQVIRQGQDRVDRSNLARAYVMYAGAKGMIAYNGGPLSKMINGAQVRTNLRRAEELRSFCPAVWWGYGSYFLLAPALLGRDLDKAQMYLEKTIAFDPLFADAYVRLAQVHQLKGDLDTFRSYLDQALEIDPLNELALDIKRGTCNFICVDVEKDQ